MSSVPRRPPAERRPLPLRPESPSPLATAYRSEKPLRGGQKHLPRAPAGAGGEGHRGGIISDCADYPSPVSNANSRKRPSSWGGKQPCDSPRRSLSTSSTLLVQWRWLRWPCTPPSSSRSFPLVQAGLRHEDLSRGGETLAPLSQGAAPKRPKGWYVHARRHPLRHSRRDVPNPFCPWETGCFHGSGGLELKNRASHTKVLPRFERVQLLEPNGPGGETIGDGWVVLVCSVSYCAYAQP